MTDLEHVQDRISKGMGLAARKYGGIYTVYRPRGTNTPIRDRNRILKICAIIEPNNGGSSGSRVTPIWGGTFDSLYTRPSDYLTGEKGTFFIGAQLPSVPICCVFTNRVVTIVRPSFATQGGYSGLYASSSDVVIDGWPASLSESGSGAGAAKTVNSTHSSWTLLLPPLPVALKTSDIVTDDLGSSYVIGAAEEGVLGWRAIAKQTTP